MIPATMITFPDLSHYNKVTVDPFALGPALINKTTQGNSFVDPTWLHRAQDVFWGGKLIGGYLFATGDDPNSQVTLFLSTVENALGTMAHPRLKLAVDYEANPGNQCSQMQAEQLVSAIRLATGKRPLLYMDYSMWQQSQGSAILMACDLWLAEYGPIAKAIYKLWQFSETNNFPGVPGKSDINQFLGDLPSLTAWWAT